MNLSAWGPVSVVGRLGGGHRNEVIAVRRGGTQLVARRSRRSAAALSWEVDLLEFLAEQGFLVPSVVPALDGRRQVDGVVVQEWLPGRPPGTSDWPAVAAELRRLHGVTAGWPQRPGFASTSDLLVVDRGGDVDLTAMPESAVASCRRAWAALAGFPGSAGPAASAGPLASAGSAGSAASPELAADSAVVHGDPCAANVRVSADGIGLLDWDEARVDHPDLDLADLPTVELPAARHRVASAAVAAWEAAAGWQLEPDYARRRLSELA